MITVLLQRLKKILRRKHIPLVEHSSKVVIGSVVGNGFGVQGSVDSWLPSLHGQAIQLHCRSDAACKKEKDGSRDPLFNNVQKRQIIIKGAMCDF